MKKKKLIIVGAGYTIDELYPLIKNISKKVNYNIVGILDDNKKFFKKDYKGIPIHIGLENAKKFKGCEFVFGIGSYKNRNSREKIFKKMQIDKNRFPNIIDRTAILENNVKLGFGNIIYPNSVICSDTKISDFCILTYSTIVAHAVKLGSFSLIGSRTSILNSATIGKEVFFGANVLVGENLKIGDFSKILLGSVVLNNVSKKTTVFGNPAKVIKHA